MKKDGKENTIIFWNAQHSCCMAEERKEPSTALEKRDVACPTDIGKIPGQKGNKLNPKDARISCSSTGYRRAGRERPLGTYADYTVPYHRITELLWLEKTF